MTVDELKEKYPKVYEKFHGKSDDEELASFVTDFEAMPEEDKILLTLGSLYALAEREAMLDLFLGSMKDAAEEIKQQLEEAASIGIDTPGKGGLPQA